MLDFLFPILGGWGWVNLKSRIDARTKKEASDLRRGRRKVQDVS